MEIEYNRDDSSDNSLHIISMIVMTRPQHLAQIRLSITEIEGGEVHASDEKGKLVVTFEAPDNRELAKRMDSLQALEHVVSSSLVYHQIT